MYIVFHTLLIITHFVCNLYYIIQQQCLRLILFIKHNEYLKRIQYNCSLINSNNPLDGLSKIPKHLAILLGHEEISSIDLVKLISWCIIAEIPYVSFYDHNGILQKSQGLIRRKLDELEPQVVQAIQWSDLSNNPNDNKTIVGNNKVQINNIYSNALNKGITDIVSKCKTRVQILSYTDGKEKIVNLTKYLAKIIDLNGLKVKDITPELLDEKLTLNNKVPDPDLAIVFGNTMCNYGFLPWQSRVTEFFTIPTHHNISSELFTETLIKFSGCQQRYGK